MSKKRYLIPIIGLLFTVFPLWADGMLDYEKLVMLSPSRLMQKGDSYMKYQHVDTAMGYYITLAGRYNFAMAETDKYLCAQACNAVGQIYFRNENYSKAFEFYLKGIKICENNRFDNFLAELYKNVGNIYGVFEDNQQAIDCYEKALEYARQYGNTDVKRKLLMNLPGICSFAEQTEKAGRYYNELIKLSEGDTLTRYFVYLNKALILANEKKYKAAVKSYKQSADYATRMLLEPRYIGSVYGELGKLYEKIGQTDSAIYYFRLNTDYSEKYKIMYMLVENLKKLAVLYEKAGDRKTAMLYKNRYLAMSDSVFNMNEISKVKNARFVYEMDKNYQKIASLASDKEQQRVQIKSQRIFLYIISVSLFVFVAMLFWVYAQKRKLYHAYKELFYRNGELLRSEQENKLLRIGYENIVAEVGTGPESAPGTMESLIVAEIGDMGQKTNKQNVRKAKEKEADVEEVRLYSANKLTSEQKETLLLGINKIMENPDEFCNCEFSLERLATLIGSNSRYVSQIINETYNKNFRSFINEYRIKEAQFRLMNTARYGNYTIKAIAESVGYKSHTNFILIFKKMTGITPSIYQKIAKENG